MVAPPNYWVPLDEREGDKENNSNEISDPGKEVEIKKAEMAQVSTENDMRIEKINEIQEKWKGKLNNRRVRKQLVVLDLAATSSFWQEQDAHIKTGVASDKVVMMPTGKTVNATEK